MSFSSLYARDNYDKKNELYHSFTLEWKPTHTQNKSNAWKVMKITGGGSSTMWWLKGYVEGGLKCWRGIAKSVIFEACRLCIVLERYGWDMKVEIRRKRKRMWFAVVTGDIGCRRRKFSMVKVDVTWYVFFFMLEGWSEVQWKHVVYGCGGDNGRYITLHMIDVEDS